MSGPKRADKKGETEEDKIAERERLRNESRSHLRKAGAGTLGLPKGVEVKEPVKPSKHPSEYEAGAFRVHFDKARKGAPSSRAQQGTAELAATKRAPEPGAGGGSVAASGTFGKSLRQGKVGSDLKPLNPPGIKKKS